MKTKAKHAHDVVYVHAHLTRYERDKFSSIVRGQGKTMQEAIRSYVNAVIRNPELAEK